MLGEGAALAAELVNGDGVLAFALGAIIFLDLPFDRQAVAIPARHIVRVLAEHPLRAGHEIFEDLVKRMADVDVTVGVRGAVVEDEFGPPSPRLGKTPVKPYCLASGRAAPALSSAVRLASENRCAAEKGSLNNREGFPQGSRASAPVVFFSMIVSGLPARARH